MTSDTERPAASRRVVFACFGVDRDPGPGQAMLRWRGELPHLEKAGGTYFVTFCIAGARRSPVDPASTASDDADAVARASEPAPSPAGELTLTGRLGSVVEDAILHFNDDRYGLHAWCVMPDHVHAVVCPYGEHRLAAIVHSWKSFTAKSIAKACGRTGSVWEREYFDHLVRSPAALERFCRYTEMNPVAAGLCATPATWPLSSARFPR